MGCLYFFWVDTHLNCKNNQTSVLATTKKSIDTLFYYTEGVKPLITPHKMRGKEAKYNYNTKGVKLNAIGLLRNKN